MCVRCVGGRRGGLQARGVDGMLPFMRAAQNGHVDCLQILIQGTIAVHVCWLGVRGARLLASGDGIQVVSEKAEVFWDILLLSDTQLEMQSLDVTYPDSSAKSNTNLSALQTKRNRFLLDNLMY